MNYVYILSGWEGSAADSRVLKDAITRENGFRVPDEAKFPEVDDDILDEHNLGFIDQAEPSQRWNNWRENLATNMFDEWRGDSVATSSRRRSGASANLSTGNTSGKCWTPEEEKVLANALKDLLVRGYKADNGFKSGYQNLFERAMI
ncbi:hypothetical protein BUALT_Bualt09G0028800 [Buddleja alternifolia]|uniref:Uncharacterized protein n=1 Tax=Buddleja alternifolia TaxID=168488 RepID=A0AAV6XA77_9LAMI|nr:hypothetical protein BUALT_Bualt09G0028800 [Buddleja alternifolia]